MAKHYIEILPSAGQELIELRSAPERLAVAMQLDLMEVHWTLTAAATPLGKSMRGTRVWVVPKSRTRLYFAVQGDGSGGVTLLHVAPYLAHHSANRIALERLEALVRETR